MTILVGVLVVVALLLGRHALALGLASVYFAIVASGVASPRMQLFGPIRCRGTSGDHCIALTFDDGPDPRTTPDLLDLLAESRTPAAFFCVGRRVDEHPGLVERMHAEGHLVANHSYEHSNLTNFFTLARLRADLARAQQAVVEATGESPAWFRPPMGLTNPRVIRAADELGLRIAGWSIRGFDTLPFGTDRIVSGIARRLHPGAVILLHDGGIPPARLLVTVTAVLAAARERGYEFRRLDQVLG